MYQFPKVGDIVLAGAGMYAELLSMPNGEDGTCVVRWLNRGEDGSWWGYHHSRVPASTIVPLEGERL
jgi:hypothetical protein